MPRSTWVKHLKSRYAITLLVLAAGLILAALVLGVRLDGSMPPDPHRDVRVGLYENPPKVYTGAQGRPAGLFVELLEAVAREEGWRLRYTRCAWAQCLEQLTQGQLDLMPDVAYSEERSQRFDFNANSVASAWSQIYTAPGLRASTLADLEGKRIAILSGGIQEAFVARMMADAEVPFTIVRVASLAAGYEAVAVGAADAIVASNFSAARNAHLYGLRETPLMFQAANLYFAAHKGAHPDLLNRIDARIAAWRQDADSVYFEALRHALAEPQSDALPRWVPLALAGLATALLLALLIGLALNAKVEERTAALASANERLDRMLLQSQAQLEKLVEERTSLLSASNQALQQAAQTAEQATRSKSSFLAHMSHEIRTPMNAILGLSHLAQQTPLNDQARDYLQKVNGAAESLLEIIDGLLDFTKAEAGKMRLEHEPFVLGQVLERVLQTAGVGARSKGLALRLDQAPGVPTALLGDAMRLGQVLLNLCANAVRFTRQGEVVLQVELLLQDASDVVLRFCVSDTGPGIAPDKQATIFDEFAQAEASTARQHGGSGLGLAISRQLVALMGGRLGVDSQLGQGASFHFSAHFGVATGQPATAPSADAAQPAASEADLAVVRGRCLLLVEDNELNQLVASEILRGAGAHVLVAGDGAQALALLRSHPDVALVLMDCQMPGMDGFEATRQIRADPRLAHLPVLAMTANLFPDDLAACRAAGMDDHIAKPFVVKELMAVLARWLGGRARR